MVKAAFEQLWIDSLVGAPLSPVWIAVSGSGLAALSIGGSQRDFTDALSQRYGVPSHWKEGQTAPVIAQIREYLEGARREFDLPIDWSVMTAFQAKALGAVYEIPYGATRTYGQIAAQIGSPNAQRAVGRANATNPIPIVIPCHRVIAADGSLRGYGSGNGIPTKAWLLALEKRQAA
jgi:methylated-DNA-[protein]-cysteine S-methyltransferase